MPFVVGELRVATCRDALWSIREIQEQRFASVGEDFEVGHGAWRGTEAQEQLDGRGVGEGGEKQVAGLFEEHGVAVRARWVDSLLLVAQLEAVGDGHREQVPHFWPELFAQGGGQRLSGEADCLRTPTRSVSVEWRHSPADS